MPEYNGKVWACGHMTATDGIEGGGTLRYNLAAVDVDDCPTCQNSKNTKELLQVDTIFNVPDFVVYDEHGRPIRGKVSGVIE